MAARAPVRRNISGDRKSRRGQDRANDLAHPSVEAARRVHPQNDEPDLTRRRRAQLVHDVVGDRRADNAVDLKQERAFGNRGSRCWQCEPS